MIAYNLHRLTKEIDMGRFDHLYGDEDDLEAQKRQLRDEKWDREADEEE